MYGISKDLEIKENNSIYFTGGIHQNVTIEKVALENSKEDGSGKNVLAFHFKGANSETFRHVEWPIDESAADAESKSVNMSKRVKHILTKFVDESAVIINNVSTFDEYVNAIVRIAGNNFANKTFEIKLVYTDKGYISFPKYVGFISDKPNTLTISPKEVVVKPSATATANAENYAPADDKF